MLIPFNKLIETHKIPVQGILHVGACMGEEYPTYKKYTDNVAWVEANPELIPIIKNAVHGQPVFNFAVCEEDFFTRKFNIIYSDDRTNPGCSSLLELKKHAEYYPMIKKIRECIVNTITLDSLVRKIELKDKTFNILNMDIQGAELLALKGAEKLLDTTIQMVYTEFAVEELYDGCCLLGDITQFLGERGFRLMDIEKAHPSWGDAVFIKKK